MNKETRKMETVPQPARGNVTELALIKFIRKT